MSVMLLQGLALGQANRGEADTVALVAKHLWRLCVNPLTIELPRLHTRDCTGKWTALVEGLTGQI